MKRSGELKRKPKRRRTADEVAGGRAWKANTGPCCMVCPVEGGICEGPIQGHHVIDQETLKRHGWHAFLWDLRGKLDVCRRRHQLHTDAVKRIPYALVPSAALELAGDLELEWWVERFYA